MMSQETLMFVKMDPSKLPDGLCWTVVETMKETGSIRRTRFALEEQARSFAKAAIRAGGCYVHLEGPEQS
jgi:hypothetical protein